MEQKLYERLSHINVHLTEAVYQLERLGAELHLDEAVTRLMTEQIDGVRRDANCWLTKQSLEEAKQVCGSRRKRRLIEMPKAPRR